MIRYARYMGDNVAAITISDDYNGNIINWLRDDYAAPQVHTAIIDGRQRRVRIDHDVTGTATTGTGDIVVVDA